MSVSHKVDQVHWDGRVLIAPPCRVLFGARQHELAPIERARIERTDIRER